MKRICALVLAIVFLVGLTACGGGGKSDDPNVGKWHAVSASMLGMQMDVGGLFKSGVTLELMANGRFSLSVDGEKGRGKWEYCGDALKLTSSDANMEGSIQNGKLTLTNLLGMGVDLTFEKEGGYADSAADASGPETSGEAGYYRLAWGSEGGETISGDDLRALGLDYYVLLNEDGTAVFQTDNTVPGTWKNGIMTLVADGVTEELPYTIDGGELTIEADGLKMVFAKSNEKPPSQAQAQPAAAENLNELQQWWNGDWYGYIYLPTADGVWEPLEDGVWDCFATIDSGATGAGSIYLWDDGGELGDVALQITEHGVGNAGVAMSEGGSFNKMEIAHADWIIDPGTNTQPYEHLIIIDGTFEDPDGSEYGGFQYEIWLRPWGMLWDDAAKEDRPPGYYDWYLGRYTGLMPTMSEFLSGAGQQPDTGSADSGGNAGSGGSAQMTTVDFDSFTVGYPAGMVLEDDWLNGQVIKDADGKFEVQFYQQYNEDQVTTVREEMGAYLKDPEAKGATEFSRTIGGMSGTYAIKYDSVIWNEAMFLIAYPQPVNGYSGLQVRIKVRDTKSKIDDVLALPQVQAVLDSIVFKKGS